MGRYRLGVVDVVFWSEPVERRAEHAAELGFEHIDVMVDVDPATLPIPVGCPTSYPKPVAGWCSTPAPARAAGTDMWERAVRWWQRSPGALLEPWAGAVVHSLETAQAMMAEVPGLRLLVDTGHVADWGGDPLELLEYAGHVQLRQGAPGSTQVHVDDARGVVDFAAVLSRLDDLGYEGSLSVEYFDIPEQGWGLDDPIAWAVDLRHHVRALLGD
ncbi:MAG TPA: TIM barrel protein [Acidimicrobiia bacterium]|nr:TIM barrel protein [Acidimicrobiia bacterium]